MPASLSGVDEKRLKRPDKVQDKNTNVTIRPERAADAEVDRSRDRSGVSERAALESHGAVHRQCTATVRSADDFLGSRGRGCHRRPRGNFTSHYFVWCDWMVWSRPARRAPSPSKPRDRLDADGFGPYRVASPRRRRLRRARRPRILWSLRIQGPVPVSNYQVCRQSTSRRWHSATKCRQGRFATTRHLTSRLDIAVRSSTIWRSETPEPVQSIAPASVNPCRR